MYFFKKNKEDQDPICGERHPWNLPINRAPELLALFTKQRITRKILYSKRGTERERDGVEQEDDGEGSFPALPHGFSATVEASSQLDPNFIINQVLNKGGASHLRSSSANECCETCICTLPYPTGLCRCVDVAESCPEACQACICTRSIPPRCRCGDSTPGDCYIPLCEGKF